MEEQVPSAPTISLMDIIINVFSSPSDAFEGIRTSPARATVWLIPLIVLILLSASSIWTVFSNDTLRDQALQAQKERIEGQLRDGKISQETADQALEGMQRGGGMMAVFGIIAGTITLTIIFFLTALVFWLVGKLALKAEGGYGKYLELWGASQWIGILGGIITLLMIIGLNSVYAGPTAALAIFQNYNSHDTVHRLLGSLNVFTLWQMVVVGIGFAKYSGKPVGTGIGVALGLWVIWILVSVFALAGFGM